MSSPAGPIFASTPGAVTRERARLSFMFSSSRSACLCPCKEIIEPVRVAGQMRKKLMLAIVDEESDITFYEAREKAMSGLMTGKRKRAAWQLFWRIVWCSGMPPPPAGCMSTDFTASP